MPLAKDLKVLVVDDQLSMRQLARYGLAQIGITQVEDVPNGLAAISSLEGRPVHVVMSDYNMPGMTGLELLQKIRAHQTLRKTPFILITGRGDRELVMKAAQAGANNFIVKPFSNSVLKTKIEAVVGKLG
ncbi:MAG: response regulator [Pseudomonadota bacterium]|nr:response regulator [Pseudomonadota bacterium]